MIKKYKESVVTRLDFVLKQQYFLHCQWLSSKTLHMEVCKKIWSKLYLKKNKNKKQNLILFWLFVPKKWTRKNRLFL